MVSETIDVPGDVLCGVTIGGHFGPAQVGRFAGLGVGTGRSSVIGLRSGSC